MSGLVLGHLMDGVVDGIQTQLLGALGQIHLAGAGAALGVHTHLQVLLGAVGEHLAQQLGKLSSMLSLLKGVTLPSLGDLGIALPVGHTAHGQVHANLAALTVEVGAQALDHILGDVLGNAHHMLGDIGVLALLHKLVLGCLADGAELRSLTLGNITTDGANELFHAVYLPNFTY